MRASASPQQHHFEASVAASVSCSAERMRQEQFGVD